MSEKVEKLLEINKGKYDTTTENIKGIYLIEVKKYEKWPNTPIMAIEVDKKYTNVFWYCEGGKDLAFVEKVKTILKGEKND